MEKRATYEDLQNVPDNYTGEIIDGQLIVTSDPSWKSYLAATLLDHMLALGKSEGCDHRTWTFRLKPAIKLGDSILVPDLAGWKKERFPSESEANSISVVPDWICEILSDETIALDKTKKMPLYAKHGLAYLWFFDPRYKNLIDVYELDLESGLWVWVSSHFEENRMRAVPFQETELEFGTLFKKIVVLVSKRESISRSEIISRLVALLGTAPLDRKPEDPTAQK